jgi:sulfur-oxidizing protein SoxY
MTLELNRRQALAIGAGAALAIGAGIGASPALAANDAADVIAKFTGGKQPIEGKVKLDLPEIAENGNTVPMTVSVDSPMTKEAFVQEILIVANGNPNAGVARFHLTPSCAPEANTRIRLAETQNVVAVARMSDGSFYTASKQVKVTIGGCGG